MRDARRLDAENAPSLGIVGNAHGHHFVCRRFYKIAGNGQILSAAVNGGSVICDIAAAGTDKSRDGMQSGSFAGAVSTDKRHYLPLIYLKGNILYGVYFVVIYVDILNLQHCLHKFKPHLS